MCIPAFFTTEASGTEARQGAIDGGASSRTVGYQCGSGGHTGRSLDLDHPIPREALLRLPEVVRITGLSETVIYERMGAGTFPLAKQVGPRTIAWPAGRVFDWLAELPDWQPSGTPAVKHRRPV